MRKSDDPKNHLSHINFILEKYHRGIKEVHVTQDVFIGLQWYVKKTNRSDCKIIDSKSLLLRGILIKYVLNGQGGIGFIKKVEKTF